MKTRFLILAGLVLVLAACPSPISGPPSYLNLSVTSATSTLPASYPYSPASPVNVTVTVTNNGRDVSTSETVICYFVVTQSAGAGYSQAYFTQMIQSTTSTAGVLNGGTLQFTFTGVDISPYGAHGVNYFYVFTDTLSGSTIETDNDTSDNIKQLNSAAINKTLPHDSWAAPVILAGGAAAASAATISLSSWYTSSVSYPTVMWYKATVTSGATYDIYWDDFGQGSGTMTGDMFVSAWHTDGTTEYGVPTDNGYLAPLQVVPSETTVLIKVDALNANGTFAVGIMHH